MFLSSAPAAGAAASLPASPSHGGDLDAARLRFPDATLPWVDLSTGINPRGYPVGPVPEAAWRCLPGTADRAALERAAAGAYRAAAGWSVVAAPGTQALIQLLPRLVPARRVTVLGFGYEEHPTAWRAAGARVSIAETVDALADADVAVVVNPNNPDGRRVPAASLATLASDLASRGGLLVVDEAFADTGEPTDSLVSSPCPEGALVLRSFGKFFGLAGLRLGFALGSAARIEGVGTALGPWAVSGPALAVATRALRDTSWQAVERTRLRAEAVRLDAVLTQFGLSIVGGTSLFRLASHQEAAAIGDRLGRAGVLVRRFPARPTWLRFGLPEGPEAWARLASALHP